MLWRCLLFEASKFHCPLRQSPCRPGYRSYCPHHMCNRYLPLQNAVLSFLQSESAAYPQCDICGPSHKQSCWFRLQTLPSEVSCDDTIHYLQYIFYFPLPHQNLYRCMMQSFHPQNPVPDFRSSIHSDIPD